MSDRWVFLPEFHCGWSSLQLLHWLLSTRSTEREEWERNADWLSRVTVCYHHHLHVSASLPHLAGASISSSFTSLRRGAAYFSKHTLNSHADLKDSVLRLGLWEVLFYWLISTFPTLSLYQKRSFMEKVLCSTLKCVTASFWWMDDVEVL